MISAPSLSAAVGKLRTTDLASVNRQAALQVRHDRKYLVDLATAAALVDWAGSTQDQLGPVQVLDVAGSTASPYRSAYYDTPGRQAYLMAARGRRDRFKVRTRDYLDTGARFLEVKTKSAAGETVKHRIPWAAPDLDPHGEPVPLTGAGSGFLAEHLRRPLAPEVPWAATADVPSQRAPVLGPVLTTDYRRTTLVLPRLPARVTMDAGLVWTRLGPGAEHADQPAALQLLDQVVVETKSSGHPTSVDHWLWRHGHRPLRLSKYCAGMALLEPQLPRNRWHRELHRRVQVQPAPARI